MKAENIALAAGGLAGIVLLAYFISKPLPVPGKHVQSTGVEVK